MKKILKIIAGIFAFLIIGYAVLNVSQSRQEISTVNTGLTSIASLQVINKANAMQQDIYFEEELPKAKLPFASINVIDVSSENYENIVDNIEHQQSVMAMMMSNRYQDTFHFSVQDYGKTKRILWINDFDKPYFNDLYEQAAPRGSDERKPWDNLWKEFGELAIGYLWWSSPFVDDNFVPSALNTNKPLLAKKIQSGIDTPYSIMPTNRPERSKETLTAMLKEMKATPDKYYSVSVLEINKENYDDTYLNIQKIQSKFHEKFGTEYNIPYHYSTQQYGNKIRILWINQFIEEQYKDIESVFENEVMWTNYISGIDKYLWWASQEINEKQKAHSYLLQKIESIKKLVTLSR